MNQREPDPSGGDDIDHEDLVPLALRVTAAWGWRLLVLAAVVMGLWYLCQLYATIIMPLLVAVLFTAMLAPVYRGLRVVRLPAPIAAICCILLIVGVVGGIFTLVGTQIASQWPVLITKAQESMSSVMRALAHSRFTIGAGETGDLTRDVIDWANRSRDVVVDWVTSAGSGVAGFFAGVAISLVATFFFLMDGNRFARGSLAVLAPSARASIEHAGGEGWKVLGQYVRAAMTVAVINGVEVGVTGLVLGSNLFVALGALEFVLAFVPIVGNLTSTAVGVSVIFVTLGPTKALIMLVVFVVMMLLEGNLWQPLLLGRAADIHPLMILLGISFGVAVAGIAGAIFAIPTVAFAIAFSRALHPTALLHGEVARRQAAAQASVGPLPEAGDKDEDSASYLAPVSARDRSERRIDRIRRQVARSLRGRR